MNRCYVINKNIVKTSTIEAFINEYIYSKTYLNSTLGEQPFSSVNLEYIIDLYELIEESIFDKVLRVTIRDKLHEESFKNSERSTIIKQFMNMTLHNDNIAVCLKDLICWISMFKRLLVRLLSPKVNINFGSSLDDYVKRTDIWKGNINEDNIRTIEIESNIRLKHAFIILEGLEAEQHKETPTEKPPSSMNSNYKQPDNQNTIQTSMNTPRKKEPKSRNKLRN